MALPCVSGGKECDGCGMCGNPHNILYCCQCDREIFVGQTYIDWLGDAYCEECWEETTDKMRKTRSRD